MEIGVFIIPTMPPEEVVKTILKAEEIGYDFCLIADEGLMPDVYACLGAAAQVTSRIRLGPVTNGYTRHPVVTSVAMATLQQVSQGRALIVLVAGGLSVLSSMGIERQKPLGVVRETITILRKLWSGENIDWEGSLYSLADAQITFEGSFDIPIWMAARGERMLAMAGEIADGVLLVGKSDIGPALDIVAQGADKAGRRPLRIYKDGIAYTEKMRQDAVISHVYASTEAPARMLKEWGMTSADAQRIRQVLLRSGPQEAAKLIAPEMTDRFQISGTPDECSQTLGKLTQTYELDGFMLNVVKPGLENNIQLMKDVFAIVAGATE